MISSDSRQSRTPRATTSPQPVDDADSLFHNRSAVPEKLIAFGFSKNKTAKYYTYAADLFDGQFSMRVVVTADGKVTADVFDSESGEIYALVKAVAARGVFAEKVRTEYDKLLTIIARQCFRLEIFKSDYAKKIIAYVKRKYGDEPEFLWGKFPRNAIFRRSDNAKWYAALLTVAAGKIGLIGEGDSDSDIEIIDLRVAPAAMFATIDGKRYFPGYHMNKKHWVTVCLDGSVPIKEIYSRIDDSYRLAKNSGAKSRG